MTTRVLKAHLLEPWCPLYAPVVVAAHSYTP